MIDYPVLGFHFKVLQIQNLWPRFKKGDSKLHLKLGLRLFLATPLLFGILAKKIEIFRGKC